MSNIAKLYDYIGHDLENVPEDMDKGYLTIDTGRDGYEYYWYADEKYNVAINRKTGRMVTEEFDFDKLFY